MPAFPVEETASAGALLMVEFDQWPAQRDRLAGPAPDNFVCSICWCEQDRAAECAE